MLQSGSTRMATLIANDQDQPFWTNGNHDFVPDNGYPSAKAAAMANVCFKPQPFI